MDIFIALVALLAIALFFVVRYKVNAAAAPFFVVAGITLLLCLLGMLKLLNIAGWLIYAFAAGALVYIFFIRKVSFKEIAAQFFTPGLVFFIVSTAALSIAMYLKHPYFSRWDEFSFWGVAAKAIFENRQLYTVIESSMVNISYPPAMPAWSFFMQFFGRVFVEWKVYLAYDVMIMSVMSILFARVKWKNAATIAVLTVFGFLSLFLFIDSFAGQYIYVTTYADLQIGIVFGGVLLAHFCSDTQDLMRWVVSLVGVMVLPMIKDIGFALALVASGVIVADVIISGHYPTQKLFQSEKKIVRLIIPALLFLGVIASYLLWAIHFQQTAGLSRAPDPYEYSIWQMLAGKDAYFNGIIQEMLKAVWQAKIVLFGTIGVMALVFTAVPITAGVLTFHKKKLLRLSVCSVLLLGGFVAYGVFLAYSYTAIFNRDVYNLELVSFGRYMTSYCAGWLLCVVGVCLFEIAVPKLKKCDLAVGATVAVLAVAAVFGYCPYTVEQIAFTHGDTSISEWRPIIHKQAQIFGDAFTVDDRFYFACQQSDGGPWFMFNYEFMPAYTVDTLGGGNFVPLETPDDQMELYDVRAGKGEFVQYLRDQDVDYVFVYFANDYFYEEFAPLFSDSLAGYADRSAFIYMVIDHGGNDIMLVPVSNVSTLEEMKKELP